MNNLNNSTDEVVECPLCMEPLEVDDLNFFPCTCGYQICRFCWHRIRTDENKLCPACRKEYPENPADFKPLTQEEMIAFKSQKRQRDQQRKQKITDNRKHLANVRVVQKNLVFVVGLPPRLADADILKKHEYFGKYGKIHKVVINPSTAYAGVQGPSASAYVTYVHNTDALRAIQSVNNIMIDGRLIKTSLGTTKYCSHFMKNQQCPKGDCMYLHELGDPEASFTKEEMHQGKHQEYEKRLHDVLIASASSTTSTSGGCGVSTTSSTSSLNNSKNSENSKASISNSTNASSVSSTVTSSVVGSAIQKEAWPSLSTSPVNQKDSITNSGNNKNNRKERSKQDKNKNEKNTKTKNNKNNSNNSNGNTVSNTVYKEVPLPVVISNSTLESSPINNSISLEHSPKAKGEKSKEKNQTSLENRSNAKSDLSSSNITENDIKDTTNVSLNLDNNNKNMTKVDSQRSLGSSSSSGIVTTSENDSIINESVSGKSSPGSSNENNFIDNEQTKFATKYKLPLAPSSSVQDVNTETNNLSDNRSNLYGCVDNLFVDNESSNVPKTPDHNITNNLDNNLSFNESADNRLDNFSESLIKENEARDSITETMAKLNLFDENSFFSSTAGILQESMPLKLKNDEIISNHLNSGTAPNLPDLINGIDGYQNTTNEWEEALQNVMIKSNKQMEEEFQQNLQQHNQNLQHHKLMKHHEDLQRLQDVHKRNNILGSLNISQISGMPNDFLTNSYLTGTDLNRQPSYLQYQQQQQQSNLLSNDGGLQNTLFGTNISKFFDFHKHQQQQKLQQHCMPPLSGPNENLLMMPLLENNRLNSQLVDQNSLLSTGQQNHQTSLQQRPNQQIGSVPTQQQQQNQFMRNLAGDDDLGFDPFIETQKALAELIENEEEQQNSVASSSKIIPQLKIVNNLLQPNQQQQQQQQHQQQHMMEYMQRARMPPPGFNHVSNFNGYGVDPRIQNSKAMPFPVNLSNNYSVPTNQHIQHQQQQQQQQLQIPSNAWATHLGNFQQQQQHINEQQLRQVNTNQLQNSGNQKSYSNNDWTAMDPAILSFRQFSSSHQTQLAPQMQPPQQDIFLQQLAQQQQQQAGFNSQSQHLGGGNIGMPNIMNSQSNSQQQQQQHINANVQGMLEYLKTRQFL